MNIFFRCVYAAAAPPPYAPDPSKASATSLDASSGKGCAAEADGDADLGEAACPCPCSRHEPLLDARLVRRFGGRVWAMHFDYARRESLSDGGSGEGSRSRVLAGPTPAALGRTVQKDKDTHLRKRNGGRTARVRRAIR